MKLLVEPAEPIRRGLGESLVNVTQRVDHGVNLRVRQQPALRQIRQLILRGHSLGVGLVDRVDQCRRIDAGLDRLAVVLQPSLGVRGPLASQFG